MSDIIKGILERLGYTPIDGGAKYWRISPLYRHSNTNSVLVDKTTGYFSDLVSSSGAPLIRLVMLTQSCDEKTARAFLQGSYFAETAIRKEEPQIKQEKTLSKEILDDLLPSYSFYLKRGISIDTLKIFGCGVCHAGKLNDRMVFPIFDFKGKLIGLTGRELRNSSIRPKWKHIGRTGMWVYPHHVIGLEIEESGECVLLESIGDGLALYEAGIKNFIVLFGLNLSKSIQLYLIRLNVQKIIIATNNDQGGINRGGDAAEKIRERLCKFFRPESVLISLPSKKDFGMMNKKEILEWKENADNGNISYPKLQ